MSELLASIGRRPARAAALLALLVHLVYFVEQLGSAFFGVPILDEVFYDQVARGLLTGADLGGLNPGFRPLLYPLFLAGAYRLGGPWDAVVAVGLQHLVAVATVWLAARIGWHLSGRHSVAGLAGGLLALAGPPLFFAGERLGDTWFAFLLTAALERTLAAERLGTWRCWLVPGALVALATFVRPNALALAPAFLVLPFLREGGWPRRFGPLAGLVAGLALTAALLAPLAGAGGAISPLAGSGGVNLYLGNKRGADGIVPRQDRPAIYDQAYRDSVQLFAEQEYRRERGLTGPVAAGEVSRYWLGRTAEEVRVDPAGRLGLLLRKGWFLLWNRELPNHKSYAFVVAEESRLLAWLPISWGVLLALAPLGFAAAWRAGGAERRGALWVVIYLALLGAAVVVFFVNDRYRLPLWPGLAALAGWGLIDLVASVRQGARAALPRLATVVGVALLSFPPWLAVELPSVGRDFLFRAMAAHAKGWDELALADARQAVELDPGEAAGWFQLALSEEQAGQPGPALQHYRAAARLRPGEPRIHNNLGVLLEQKGEEAAAYQAYRTALEHGPGYGPALVNAALMELRAGQRETARARLAAARAAGYDSPSAVVAAAELGEVSPALTELRARQPALVAQISVLLARPLDPAVLSPGSRP